MLVSAVLGEPFSYERVRETRLRDLHANKAEALQALRTLTMAEGEELGYPESPGIVRYSMDWPGGSALAWFNDAASSCRLEEEVLLDVEHMLAWALLPDGCTVLALDVDEPLVVSLEPGEAQLLVLRPTEQGEELGYSYSFEYTYSIEALV